MCEVQMLKVFVNQRLTAAVEDIFVVLERKIAEYEEELSRTKEENERQRQLLDAVFNKHQVVFHRTDAQQWIGHQKESPLKSQGRNYTLNQDPQPPLVKEEEENSLLPHIEEGEEVECLRGQEETDLTKFPLIVVSVKTEDHEDKPPESSQLHPSTNVQQLVGHQEEALSLLLEVSSPLKQEEPQPPNITEEEEERCITREGECLLGQEEVALTKFPLTVVCVKTEDHEDKPPESSQLHQSPSEEKREVEPPSSSSPQHMTTEGDGDHSGGSQADNLLAPLSDSDDSTSQVDVNMESHMKTQTGEKPFSCSVCGKRFSQKRYMQIHMRTHTGEKKFSCSVCGKRLTHKRNIQIHMRTHTGEKPFICSVCGKGFPQKGSIQIHMKTHTGEKPFSCSVCGQLFSEKQNMRRHMKTHTGEKPFNCSVCGKIFSEKQNLQLHMRSHTGEKPFNCSVCSEKFSDKQNMQRHMKSHSGEKPFNCSVCAKGFVIKCRLTHHMRTHTGEKPFSCSVCNKRYIDKYALQRHMKTHTGK
nr:zinc finger protein 391-like isoform X1 [Nerophis lumbriciformis]